MANILFIYEKKDATVAATERFYSEIEKRKEPFGINFRPINKVSNKDINGCDYLFMIRPNHSAFAKIAKKCKKINKRIVFFIDDDLLNVPKSMVSIPWRTRGLKQAAVLSDFLITPSQFIVESYNKKFSFVKTLVVDTAVPEEEIVDHRDHLNKEVKIVYAAGLAHELTFDHYIRPILFALDKKFGKKISLSFMGVHPRIDTNQFNMPIRFIEALPLDKYRERIGKENFDIGLAPLESNNFTRCKYFNKFIEYAMFGIVGIYSDTEPYTFVVEDQKNGFLAGDSPTDWLKVISNAVDNADKLEPYRANAYKTLRERFDLCTIIDSLFLCFPDWIDPHLQTNRIILTLGAIKLFYKISVIGDYLLKLWFYYRQRGFAEVIKRIMRFTGIQK